METIYWLAICGGLFVWQFFLTVQNINLKRDLENLRKENHDDNRDI